MTREYVDIGYLEQDYLDQDYASGTRLSSGGMQFNVVVDSQKNNGLQFQGVIDSGKYKGTQFHAELDNIKNYGLQYNSDIIDYKNNHGIQYQPIIDSEKYNGLQFSGEINNVRSLGLQFKSEVEGTKNNHGLQFIADINRGRVTAIEFLKNHYQSYYLTGYLDGDYGEGPYLTEYFGIRLPLQFLADTATQAKRAFQYQVHVANYPTSRGLQHQTVIDKSIGYGTQFQVVSTQSKNSGLQFQAHILDKLKNYGMQLLGNLTKERGLGVQFQGITQKSYAIQFLSTIYNTKYLRILHNFKSRGLTNTNWSSNSTMSGDFGPNNLDTDIVEQVWRSENGVKSSLKLTCDVGLNTICYMDTLAILNHNMTVAANIVLLMSNDPLFSSGVTAITIKARKLNTYYISPDLPTQGFRYFQFQIDDITNTNPYIEIGTIVFGAADIIHGENFTDEVDFEMVDYSDTINTEGFTNVSNSRALKRKLTLQFDSLDYEKRNYAILRNIYQTYRTTHKCLWLPTPDVIDQDKTDRLAIFGKLTTVPKERHNNKGGGADYVTFTIDLDESL